MDDLAAFASVCLASLAFVVWTMDLRRVEELRREDRDWLRFVVRSVAYGTAIGLGGVLLGLST